MDVSNDIVVYYTIRRMANTAPLSPPTAHPARPDLADVVRVVREHSGVTGKRHIAGVRRIVGTDDPLHGPGDDGAVVELDGARAVVCGEAIAPAFVTADPYGAGTAAVLANVNDIAAMGAVPHAIVNTLVGRAAEVDRVLDGMRDAAAIYRVPIVGGHLTASDGDASLSAFALGQTRAPLSMAHVRPGQAVLLLSCLRGTMRSDFPFFTTLEQQRETLADDVRLLAGVAESGAAVAAKDVSMAGPLGSLAMLLEFTRHGAVVDLDAMPIPSGVDPLRWAVSFPTYSFWLTAAADRVPECLDRFAAHPHLTCAAVGEVTESSQVVLTQGSEHEVLMDLARESVTGLWA